MGDVAKRLPTEWCRVAESISTIDGSDLNQAVDDVYWCSKRTLVNKVENLCMEYIYLLSRRYKLFQLFYESLGD